MHRLVPTQLVALGLILWSTSAASAAPVKPYHNESWFEFQFHGQKVGYLQALDEDTQVDGQPAIHAHRHSEIVVKRKNHIIRMAATTDSYCRPDGTPIEFRHVRIEGESRRTINGTVEGKQMVVRAETGGAESVRRYDLSGEMYLSYTIDEILRRRGLAKTRRLAGQVIIEDEGAAQPFELVVTGKKQTADGPVYVVNSKIGKLESVETFDANANLLRSDAPALGAVFLKTTKAKALETATPPDIFTRALLSANVALPRGETLNSIQFRLTGKSGRAPKPILDRRQKKLRSGKASIDIEISASEEPRRPGVLNGKLKSDLRRFLKETDYEALRDERLVRASKKAVAGAKDLWTAAKRINAFVHRHIQNKSLSQAFSTATEALESGEGDCTEHAVLFSALAKIAGVPTRLVTGLVYVGGPDRQFGYHEWVEVWAGDRWVAVDPTFGQDLADPTHIKFTEGLSDAEGLREAGIVAAELFGDIQLQVLSYKTIDNERVQLGSGR